MFTAIFQQVCSDINTCRVKKEARNARLQTSHHIAQETLQPCENYQRQPLPPKAPCRFPHDHAALRAPMGCVLRLSKNHHTTFLFLPHPMELHNTTKVAHKEGNHD